MTNNLIHWDRLYGQGKITAQDLAIYQTPQFARLNRVSLSAVPTWSQPAGICASKAEHSRGVRHLAKILTQKKEFKKDAINIILAATLHDIGTPPFSHVAEPFQIAVTGQNHEEFSRQLLINTKISQVIKDQKGDLNTILCYIEGKCPPLSDLINGTIDLDNLDNSLRFGQSMGLIDAKSHYQPEILVNAFIRLKDSSLALNDKYLDQIKAWERSRHQVYDYVYSKENLAPAAMLTRALQFALQANELPKKFFLKTDDDALYYLLHCNQKTHDLINRAYHWKFYQQIFSYKKEVDSPVFSNLYHYTKFSQLISDILAKQLKLKPEDVCLIVTYDKGFRKIHLPIVGKKKLTHQPEKKPMFYAKLFVNPIKKINSSAAIKLTKTLLKDQKLLKKATAD